jgi:hypothetical protein
MHWAVLTRDRLLKCPFMIRRLMCGISLSVHKQQDAYLFKTLILLSNSDILWRFSDSKKKCIKIIPTHRINLSKAFMKQLHLIKSAICNYYHPFQETWSLGTYLSTVSFLNNLLSLMHVCVYNAWHISPDAKLLFTSIWLGGGEWFGCTMLQQQSGDLVICRRPCALVTLQTEIQKVNVNLYHTMLPRNGLEC